MAAGHNDATVKHRHACSAATRTHLCHHGPPAGRNVTEYKYTSTLQEYNCLVCDYFHFLFYIHLKSLISLQMTLLKSCVWKKMRAICKNVFSSAFFPFFYCLNMILFIDTTGTLRKYTSTQPVHTSHSWPDLLTFCGYKTCTK